MQTKKVIELFEEAGHVGELSRLLSVFKLRRTKRLGKVELIELASRTAGANYRYPNPEPALQAALAIGLLQKDKQIIVPTETGKLFLRWQGGHGVDLTFEQANLLLGLLLDDASSYIQIGSLLRRFGQGTGDRLEAKSSPSVWDVPIQSTARILQQLGLLEEDGGRLFINTAFESALPRNLLQLTIIDERALWDRLDAQRLRAKKAEELVLAEEQKRLIKVGRPDLAQLIIRVSAEDVSAGYDIGSFESDGTHRLIEVKSSTGRVIRFEWSIREREVASENGNRYWIYFVPLANVLEKRSLPILMIRDPGTLVDSGKLTETPSSFVVCANSRLLSSSSRAAKADTHSLLTEWPS